MPPCPSPARRAGVGLGKHLLRLSSPRPPRERKATMRHDAAATLPTPPRVYWLLARGEAGRTEMLTVDLDGRGGALAVFGFEDEAEMFSLWASGGEWRLKETTAEELARILSGPYAALRFVALDPLPELLVCWGMVGLVSLRRERFVDRLLEKAGLGRAEPLAL
jgi:hypothetical protein